jgi:hypothetical protein
MLYVLVDYVMCFRLFEPSILFSSTRDESVSSISLSAATAASKMAPISAEMVN